MVMDTPIEYRICSACIDLKPITRFRPRKGGRHGVCNDCHADLERERRSARRRKKLDKFASTLRGIRSDKAARTATALMIHRMGGIEGFVIAWHEQFDAASKERPGGREAVNGLLAILRLIEACQQPPPDCSLLSDEDLQRELDRELGRFLKSEFPEAYV